LPFHHTGKSGFLDQTTIVNFDLNTDDNLLLDLKQVIDHGRLQAVAAVNSALTLTYWQEGKRINDEVLEGERAEYGKQIVARIAEVLTQEYGKGFEAKNRRRMMKFAGLFPDFQIVAPLVRQLSWLGRDAGSSSA